MPETQDLDVYRTDDLEEEVEKAGFHVSPLGAFSITICFMLLVPIILAPEKTTVMNLIWILFIIGFAAHRGAEVSTVFQFHTTFDALWWGIPLGAVIAVVEVFVAQNTMSTIGNIGIDPLSMALMVVSVGAVAEEMLYRSGIQIPIRQYLIDTGLPVSVAAGVAVSVSSLTFSFGHMYVFSTWNMFGALFVGGLFYGASFEYKKDLTVPIVAHLVVNLSGYRDQAVSYLAANPLLLMLILLVTAAFIFIKTRT